MSNEMSICGPAKLPTSPNTQRAYKTQHKTRNYSHRFFICTNLRGNQQASLFLFPCILQ
jgi:hypothetical protein